MSKYDKDTKFYWLQLKEDFFEDDAIQWLEDQKPNGRDYAYFYLKLCLKSLKTNGVLIRNVGKILIPYDNEKLAELTRTDFDTVTVAMELLKQIGLIEILENGEIYIRQLEKLIGSKSLGALKKQQQRLISGQVADKCPPKIENRIIIKNININIYNNIVEYLNKKTNSSFKPTTKSTQSHIKARLNEGFVEDDFKKVIDVKTEQWLKDNKMKQYLRPETLFGTKFEGYLQEYKTFFKNKNQEQQNYLIIPTGMDQQSFNKAMEVMKQIKPELKGDLEGQQEFINNYFLNS